MLLTHRAYFQCQLISTPTQLNLNSISTKLRLNLISTSFQPQVQINLSLNINLNSTSTLTSTQYGCDIKATQSCLIINHFKKIAYSNNKLTQLITLNILHTTYKKISFAVTTPKINDNK